jgi:hypothetical protein
MASSDDRTRAEEIAEATGIVVGAASRCAGVTEERLMSAVGKVGAIVAQVALDDTDAQRARDRFDMAFEAGNAAVENGTVDSESVESAFEALEETLTP